MLIVIWTQYRSLGEFVAGKNPPCRVLAQSDLPEANFIHDPSLFTGTFELFAREDSTHFETGLLIEVICKHLSC